MIAKGYNQTSNSNYVIVNDPYGNALQPNYGHSRNGEGVQYTW